MPDENENKNLEVDSYEKGSHPELIEQIYEDEDEFGFSLKRDIQPKLSPISTAFISLFGGFIEYQLLGGLLMVLIFGLDLEHAPANGMRLITMAGEVLFMLLPALIFTKFVYEDITNIIRAHKVEIKEVLLFLTGSVVLFFLFQDYLYIQDFVINKLAAQSSIIHSIKSFFDGLNESVEKTYLNLITPVTFYDKVLIVIVIAFVPAICEEVLFRGLIQRSFEFKVKPVWAAFITALFFGAFHVNPYAFVPLVALGFYFGFAVYKSNSILVSMILHFFNNFVSVILFFVIGNEDFVNSKINGEVDLSSSIFYFVLLLTLFIGIVVYINRYYSQKKLSRR